MGTTSAAYAERLKKDEENQSRLAERVAELMSKPSPASLHNISTPGTGTAVIDNMTAPFVMQRLKWDDRAKRDLAKFVDVAIDSTVSIICTILSRSYHPDTVSASAGCTTSTVAVALSVQMRVLPKRRGH